VLVIALALGAVFLAKGIYTGKASALVQSTTLKAWQVAMEFARGPDDGKDRFPVSSIARQTEPSPKRSARTHDGRYPVCSNVSTREDCVVDGDTFYLGRVAIRILDIDAPETHPPRCASEADLGDRATTRLSTLLSAGPFQLVREGRDADRYGRKLRVVMRNGRSIGAVLVAEGLARKWTGKRRPWCPGGPST
jgi:endonuclease YncB( thermonuclease family)